MIIARYITKELAWTFLAITGVLLLIVLSNRFAVYLAKAATGELPVGLVFRIVGLYIPELLSYLIPLSFFMAILFAYGRLHADSEMTVLSACGISWFYVVRITLYFATLVMILTAILTLWLVPTAALIREQALSEGESFGVMQTLLPGRFQTLADGKLVFYLEEVSSKHERLKGVFIAEQPTPPSKISATDSAEKNKGWTVISAEEAHVKRDANAKTKDLYLVLDNGYRYQGMPGNADYAVMKFAEYGRAIPFETDPEPTHNDALRLKDTSNLTTTHIEDAAELQWRLSLPISVLILGLLAIPLAHVRPRQGRFAKFLPAILIYIVYYNLFTVSRRWVAAGILPSSLGVWWVHALFLLLGLGLIAKESGWLREKSAKTIKNSKRAKSNIKQDPLT